MRTINTQTDVYKWDERGEIMPFISIIDHRRQVTKIIRILGKTYPAALPVAHITHDVMYVHKAVGHDGNPLKRGWVVTHGATGLAVARGNTRAEAISNATAQLLVLTPISYQQAVDISARALADYLERVSEGKSLTAMLPD